MSQQGCIVCGEVELSPLVDFGMLPCSGIFLDSERETAPVRPLSFRFCRRCGFIAQRRSSALNTDYGDVTRGTERQLPDYVDRILDGLRPGHRWGTELVIEVGANDGTFLDRLARDGCDARAGIEPSRALAQACRHRGHSTENVHLTRLAAPPLRARYGAAHAVVCRHTLEHVDDPLDLLAAMRILLDDGGILFIEVPAVSPIVERLFAFELWDEHLSYFSEHTLAQVVTNAGFSVQRIETRQHLASINILCWARPFSGKSNEALPFEAANAIDDCERFSTRWKAYCAHIQSLANDWPRPLYAIGASHPQSNFLNFTGLGAYVDTLVDDDPKKRGRFVPLPKPTRIVATDVLMKTADSGTVLLTAFGYTGWMEQIRRQLKSSSVKFVDPIEELARF